jgi:hypothetical protein
MEKTLKIVNSMVEKGIIKAYAIGGGMAATYYGEPTLTDDLDLFVYLAEGSDDIRPLKSIYEHLKGRGYKESREGIIIEGNLTQFLPPYNALIEEAVNTAIPACFGKTETRIVSLEHLIAIMVQTTRLKDWGRIANLLEIANDPNAKILLDKGKLNDILKRHGLIKNWHDHIKEKEI